MTPDLDAFGNPLREMSGSSDAAAQPARITVADDSGLVEPRVDHSVATGRRGLSKLLLTSRDRYVSRRLWLGANVTRIVFGVGSFFALINGAKSVPAIVAVVAAGANALIETVNSRRKRGTS
jgi:hypothetical protein